MESIALVENALGVDLELMLGDVLGDLLGHCTTHKTDNGSICYMRMGDAIAFETDECGAQKLDMTSVGKVQLALSIRDRLVHISDRIEAEAKAKTKTYVANHELGKNNAE